MRTARMRFDRPWYDAIITSATAISGGWTYTITLGYWDGRTAESTGGTWVNLYSGRTFTAWAEIKDSELRSDGLGYCTVKPRSWGPTLGQTFTIIGQSGVAGMFPVKVKVNSSDGAGPTYDVFAINNTTSKLNTGSPLAPSCSRARLNTTLTPLAPADFSFGSAFTDDAGAIVLFDLPETVGKAAC